MKRYAGAFLPALLSVVLFGVTVFWLVLPRTEEAILAKKKEMLSELTLSVWSLLSTYHQQEVSGLLPRDVAQARVLDRLRQMRYGEDGKDYFWVTDLAPRVLMHPFRPDMEGLEVSRYTDSHGSRLFQQMADVARERGQGYVTYIWQWKDDPTRLVPKLSHVRLFEPWGWVVGTGIYTDDVQREMDAMTRNLTLVGAGVMVLVSLLAGYITWRNIRTDSRRKLAEDALAEGEEKFRGISANALDGIVMIDKEGRISFWNRAAENIFGYAAEEVMGLDMHLLLAPSRFHDSYREAFSSFQGTGKGEAVGRIIELNALRRNGEEFPVELSVAPLTLRGRMHAVGVIRDITERKRGEAALLQSEEKFRKLFYASPVMLAISTKTEGRLLELNDTALAEIGFSRQEVIGKTVQELNLYVDPGLRAQEVEDHLRTGRSVRREVAMRRKDGSQLDLLWSADPIEYEGQDCLLSVLVNITEAKRAQREKQQLEDRLRQAQKMEAIGTLAGGIAHDFNNILSAVLGYADLALMRLPKDDKAHHHVRQVYQAGLRARELVQQILAFSRQTKLEKSPLELRLLVKEALKMLRATIPSTITMQSDLKETTGKVVADPGQLHQIVMNLCANAAQAMGREGGELKVGLDEVTIAPGQDAGEEQPPPGEYISLTVEDTGCGMNPQTMERIFEPFFTTKGKGEGTGLGLSVVHGIVKELGGHISVSSSLGEGTAFRVLLPKHQGDGASDDLEVRALPRGQERILVVDDEETVAQSQRFMLESLGYQVTVSNSSEQAWDMLRQRPGETDLLLTDLAMPHMDGIELIRRVRSDGGGMPIILATGFADEKHVTPGLLKELAVSRLVLKPIILAELAQGVRRALDGEG